MSSNEVFGSAINCMDGRAIRAVMEWFEKNLDILYVDSPTDAGPVKDCDRDADFLEHFRKRIVDISVGKHGSRHVAVVGHAECAGNPVEQQQQLDQIARYVEVVKGWFSDRSDVQVFGLWCERQDGGGWVAVRTTDAA